MVDTVAINEKYALDMTMGPVFQTTVAMLSGGYEDRNQDWPLALWRYDITLKNRPIAEIREFISHLLGRRGAVNSFPLRDPLDNSLTNENIGTGNGSTTEFRITKTYADADRSYLRPLAIVSSLVVKVAGVTQVDGTDYEDQDGWIAFANPPTLGQAITVTCDFLIPVRYQVDHNPASLPIGPGTSNAFASAGPMTLMEVRVAKPVFAAPPAGLSINGTPVLSAIEDEPYDGFTVLATGGTVPYVYSVNSGSLPAGITLNSSTGVVSGTPTTPGTSSGIVIRVTDNVAATDDLASFDLEVTAADLTDLMIDTSSHTPPGASLPAFGVETIDPTFGVPIWRISDPGQPIGGTGGTWGTVIHHQYMRFSAWNADESILFIETNTGGSGSGGLTFLDGEAPYDGLYQRAAPAGWIEGRWDRIDPARMIYCTSTALYYYDVATGGSTLIRSFSGTYTSMGFGSYEGDTSWDGDYVPFYAVRTSDGDTVAFAYRISDDTIMGNISITDLSPKTINDGMVHVSPYGTYLLLYFDDETQAVYTINGVLVDDWAETERPSHASLTVDENDDEVVVGSRSGVDGAVIKRRLSDGAITVLNPDSFAYHTGGSNYQNPLWVTTDYWDDSGSPYVGEIVIIALDGSAVGRICHHYPGTGGPDYDAEPHACISPSGKRIIFASAWGEGDDRPVNIFVADFRDFELPGVG